MVGIQGLLGPGLHDFGSSGNLPPPPDFRGSLLIGARAGRLSEEVAVTCENGPAKESQTRLRTFGLGLAHESMAWYLGHRTSLSVGTNLLP